MDAESRRAGHGTMEERVTLGRTGLRLCRLGLGGIPIQRVGERQAVDVVVHAVETGVDFIDTSRMYTTSERRIGLALRRTARPVAVASKSMQRTAEGLLADLAVSLRELGQDRLALYQCHAVRDEKDYERVIAPGGALEGLRRARDEGRIGHLGVTSHSRAVLGRAVDDGHFDTIMACLSFLEPEAAESLIPAAVARGVGVIAMKPFSGGAIEDPRLALRFVLEQPQTLVIAGVEDRRLFDRNWAVFLDRTPLSAEERRRIGEIRRQQDRLFCRRCDYCLPCPEGISIQHVLGIRWILKRTGPGALREGSRVREVMERARRCSGCGICQGRCPYDLPIPELIRGHLRWIDECHPPGRLQEGDAFSSPLPS